MPITRDQVLHVASLAGLKLNPSELEKYSQELAKIVVYVDRIAAINTEEVGLRARPAWPQTMFRDDVVRPSLSVEDALSNAPQRVGDYFVVPRVI
jgi:aspartyl-tRNA(Asn)/glutamyl-tRNA(Gln) amidotransferase subunit C